MISIKVYDNMNSFKKLKMLILNMVLNFAFLSNIYFFKMWYSKQSTYSCFHPIKKTYFQVLTYFYNVKFEN
jgi:predicted metallopeptidase